MAIFDACPNKDNPNSCWCCAKFYRCQKVIDYFKKQGGKFDERAFRKLGGDNDQYFSGAILGTNILGFSKADKAQIAQAGDCALRPFLLPYIVK